MEKDKLKKTEEEKDVQEIGLGDVINKKDVLLRTEELTDEPKNVRLNPNPNREELSRLPSTTKNTM